jgi:two-component system, NtrC family, response regulator AtoC
MTDIQLLVVDDDDLFRRSIQRELDKMGYCVRTAETSGQALAEVQGRIPDVVLLDIMLPDRDGLDLLDEIKSMEPSVEVVMLTAYGSIDTAVASMLRGAYHYLTKPAKLAEIDAVVRKAYEKRTLNIENRSLKENLRRQLDRDIIVGASAEMKKLLSLVERVARTEQTVLVQGESGTGKELIARRIHQSSARSSRPFVLVDCASLQKGLLESELFGHEKGAFTGAVSLKHGLLETAHMGTLFADEVSSLEPEIQSRFLRMLETGEYRRVGGTSIRKSNVRIVAATNIDLSEAVRQERFREDLYFRLSVIVLPVPPLRERKEDIPLLAEHFLRRAEIGQRTRRLSSRALEELCRYNWPGNVRELRNVIERATILSEGDVIEPWDLRMFPRPADRLISQLNADGELVPIRELQDRYIRLVLERVHGHQLKAADILGVNPKTIYRNLRKKED